MKELVDEPFLAKLLEVAKCYGWNGDYTEIGWFVEALYKIVGLEVPDTDPYEVEYTK